MAYYMPEIAFCGLALGFLHGTAIARNSSHPNLEIGPKLLERSRETSERKKFGRPEVNIQIHGAKKKICCTELRKRNIKNLKLQ